MYLEGGAGDIDPNFNSLTTIQMPRGARADQFRHTSESAIYGPCVGPLSGRRFWMCKVNGLMAMFDASGFTVRVGNAELD